MNSNFYSFISVFCALFLSSECAAQEQPKPNYSLFNPVPKEQVREMETDRPDVTESPFTVDAGHFQYETDLIRMIREKSDSRETHTLLINQANLKIGITGSTAIQIGFQTYGRQKEKELSSANAEIQDGHGDLTFRIKQNLIGNDHGKFVMAILPYVKFPTSKYDDNSRFEAGLIVPMLYKLPGDWKLGFQVEADRLKDKDQDAMHTEFFQSLTVSHSLIKGIDGIAETYYTYDFKAHKFSNFINAAIQMEVAKDMKFDAGFNFGIQHSAEKHYFIGASYRL
ncbi:transporter [Chryseobacterium sp. SSA4.19]|uniref:transporter n=1 Tax=Chryseobacterium sp. SSA4.19 TaxID=2919915 RepID=UPI001F4ECDC7|nr:transporter [Chryseobacterium sp. SSA4.19]MCJ8153045.1 transporter [Chryseobacterium sp. SSA4.19]